MDGLKRSVLHLEGAADSEGLRDWERRVQPIREKLKNGEIGSQEFSDALAKLYRKSRDVRSRGTALFCTFKDRRYLLTARHVLHDKVEAKRSLQELDNLPVPVQDLVAAQSQNSIFGIVFRVPTLDEVSEANKAEVDPGFLMNLAAGTSRHAPYTFSDPDMDLAVVSLDNRDGRFAEGLLEMGYTPYRLDDGLAEVVAEGEEILTVGFPGSVSEIGRLSLHPAEENWRSGVVSLPAFTFGRVSMLHAKLPYFWGDMTVYPGNSGGPVFAGGKLVGIVSSQAAVPIDDLPEVGVRVPMSQIIHSKLLMPLLERQIENDNY